MIVMETQRLLLRRPLLNDLDAVCEIYADSAAARRLGVAPTREAIRRLLTAAAADFERDGTGLLTVVDHRQGEVIGQCGVQMLDVGGRSRPVLTCVIHPRARRHGLATEAAAAVRDRWREAGSGDPPCVLLSPDDTAGSALAAKLGGTDATEVTVNGVVMRMLALAGGK